MSSWRESDTRQFEELAGTDTYWRAVPLRTVSQ